MPVKVTQSASAGANFKFSEYLLCLYISYLELIWTQFVMVSRNGLQSSENCY